MEYLNRFVSYTMEQKEILDSLQKVLYAGKEVPLPERERYLFCSMEGLKDQIRNLKEEEGFIYFWSFTKGNVPYFDRALVPKYLEKGFGKNETDK